MNCDMSGSGRKAARDIEFVLEYRICSRHRL